MDRQELEKRLKDYTFYQTIDLGHGVKTPGLPLAEKQRKVLALINSTGLAGKRVIDLGCESSLFAIGA